MKTFWLFLLSMVPLAYGQTLNSRSIGIAKNALFIGKNIVQVSQTRDTLRILGGSFPGSIGEGDSVVVGSTPQTGFVLNKPDSVTLVLQSPLNGIDLNSDLSIFRAFHTMQAWEDARGGDLVQDKRIEKGVCYNDGEFSNVLVISGSTTDSAFYMWLTVAPNQRHNGKKGQGVRINRYKATNGGILISNDFTIVEWLEIFNLDDQFGSSAIAVWGQDPPFPTQPTYGVVIRNNFLHNHSKAITAHGIFTNHGNSAFNTSILNNFVSGFSKGIRSETENNNASFIAHNTVFGCDTGIIVRGIGNILDTVIGNISIGNNVNWEFDDPGEIFGLSNGAEPGDSLFGGKNVLASPFETFFDTSFSGLNLHLKQGSVFTNRSNAPEVVKRMKLDIDAMARNDGVYDLGADEFPGTSPPADTVHLFVDFDQPDNSGNARSIASAKKDLDSTFALIPAMADSTYVINILPSHSSNASQAGRLLIIDGNTHTFPSWDKSLIFQSYYTEKDSLATLLGYAQTGVGMFKIQNSVSHVHFKRLRFLPDVNPGAQYPFVFEWGNFQHFKVSECVFDTGTSGADFSAILKAFSSPFFDSIDVFNNVMIGNGGSAPRVFADIWVDSNAVYGVRFVNNTVRLFESILHRCFQKGSGRFLFLNNIFSGVFSFPSTVEGTSNRQNTFLNFNCYDSISDFDVFGMVQGPDTLNRDPRIYSFDFSNALFAEPTPKSPVVGFGKDSVTWEQGVFSRVTPENDFWGQTRSNGVDLGAVQATGRRTRVLIVTYPGDCNNDGTVNILDVLPLGVFFGESGSPSSDTATAFGARVSTVWDDSTATYADADGNGVIEAEDILIIAQNWGQSINIPLSKKNKRPVNAILLEIYSALLKNPGTGGFPPLMAFLEARLFGHGAARYALSQNIPNPFNPATTIRYALPGGQAGLPVYPKVLVSIFNARGQKVRDWIFTDHKPGFHELKWNGRNSGGKSVPSGIYVYRLNTPGYSKTRRMTLLK